MWFGRKKEPMASLRGLGPPAAALDADVTLAGPLRPMDALERAALGVSFEDEEFFYGADVQWLGHAWEARLAAVSGKTYKIALEVTTSNEDAASHLSSTVFQAVSTVLGKPTEGRKPLWLWTAADGNAVLQLSDDWRIMLFLTSRAIRGFTRT